MMFDENGDRIPDYDLIMEKYIDCLVESLDVAEEIIQEGKFLPWVQNICEEFPEVKFFPSNLTYSL